MSIAMRVFLMALAGVWLGGCVSARRYRDVEMAYKGSQARVAELVERVATYEKIYRESREGVVRAEKRALGK